MLFLSQRDISPKEVFLSISKDWKRWLLIPVQRKQNKTSRNMESQGTMTSPKNHNNLLVTDPKDVEICNLPDEFKVIVFRKLNKLQENTER